MTLPELVIEHHGKTIFGPMEEWLSQKRVPPVLLITGLTGVGKRSIATFIAQWILCERNGPNGFSQSDPQDSSSSDLFGGGLFAAAPIQPVTGHPDSKPCPKPCNECTACHRAIHNTWVDFTEIQADEETGTLKIDQFRKIKSSLGFGAHEGNYRIVLIPNADRMTTQAANSILKLLEEPPRGWIFLLTASDPTLILPTVLSRCQRIRLRPFATANLINLLSLTEVPVERREVCAELAQGSWGKALSIAGDDVWKQRKIIFDFLNSPKNHLNQIIDWAAQEPRYFDLLVDQLESVTADLIRWSLNQTRSYHHPYQWKNSDGSKALQTHAQACNSREFWIEQAERTARARQEALAPLNRKLLVQDLLLPWVTHAIPQGTS